MSGRNARAGNCKKRDSGLGRVYCWKARAAFVCVCPMPRLLVPFGFGDLWPARVSWHVCVSALLRWKIHLCPFRGGGGNASGWRDQVRGPEVIFWE